MITAILPMVLLAMYLGLTYKSVQIIQEVGNNIDAQLTQLGMLIITVWAISSAIILSWILF